jgi:hypothetical protein
MCTYLHKTSSLLPQSHTNVSWLWVNLMNSCTTTNLGRMQVVRPMTTSMLHKNSIMVLITSMAWRSSFILITKDMYFIRTIFIRDNIEIHLVFTLWSNLFCFVSNNYVSLHSENASWVKRKYVYAICNWFLISYIMECFESVCTTKFV